MPNSVSPTQYSVSFKTMCLPSMRWEKLIAALVRKTFSARMAGVDPSGISPRSLSLSQTEMRQQACLLTRCSCSREASMQETYSLKCSRQVAVDPSIFYYADNTGVTATNPVIHDDMICSLPSLWGISCSVGGRVDSFILQRIKQSMKEMMKEETLEEHINYSKKMGSYRPRFEGKPDDYYELECGEVSCAISVCFLIVVFFFFLCVAFFEWSNNNSTEEMILVWSIVLCVFVPAFMIAAYIGSNNKMEIEERLIKEALRKIMDQKRGKKGEQEEREGKLKEIELSMTVNKLHIDG